MKKLIIDRKTWLRGEGPGSSYLKRRSDGKKCCIGFFCEQILGLTETDILKQKALIDLENSFIISRNNTVLGDDITDEFYFPNDVKELKEIDREALLTANFLKYGIEVEFIN